MVLESHCGIYVDVSVYYLYVCKHHASTFQVQKLHVCMSHSNSEELTIVLCIAKKPAHLSMMVLRYAYLAGPEAIQPAVCAACLSPPNVV